MSCQQYHICQGFVGHLLILYNNASMSIYKPIYICPLKNGLVKEQNYIYFNAISQAYVVLETNLTPRISYHISVIPVIVFSQQHQTPIFWTFQHGDEHQVHGNLLIVSSSAEMSVLSPTTCLMSRGTCERHACACRITWYHTGHMVR